VYGASKLAGERILLEQAPARSTIVRTSWLYAAQGQNFLNTMLRLMQSKDELNVVDDQRGSPTAAHELAKVLWAFAGKRELTGIYHWSNKGEASWYDFACEIQQQALAMELLTRNIPLKPITTAQYPTPARRPAYSVLDKSASSLALGIEPMAWKQALGEVLKQLQRINTYEKAVQEKS
jgi:dTDP-4-dehydrorhamnose reductase